MREIPFGSIEAFVVVMDDGAMLGRDAGEWTANDDLAPVALFETHAEAHDAGEAFVAVLGDDDVTYSVHDVDITHVQGLGRFCFRPFAGWVGDLNDSRRWGRFALLHAMATGMRVETVVEGRPVIVSA